VYDYESEEPYLILAPYTDALESKNKTYVTATAQQIALMTTEDFKQYKALVFGNSYFCDPEQWSNITASRAAWSPAVEGNVAIIGSIEAAAAYWGLDGAAALISNALDFVAGKPNKTGLYFSLGCNYYNDPSENQVSALDGIGTFKVVGTRYTLGFYSTHVVAAHPVTAGIIDTDLSNWDFANVVFTSYPSPFKPLTIVRNRGEDWLYDGGVIPVTNYSDGTRGVPSVLARGGSGATCGNGIVEAGEECEDGNALDGDGCSQYCRVEVCGDGLVGKGEACDDGDNFLYNCTSNCTIPRCGDGVVTELEECDDNNTVDFDGCSSECNLEYCGDGIVQPGEECEYGIDYNCSYNCKFVRCGDGIIDRPQETCDDNNTVDFDGCNSECNLEYCGDGIVQPGEECDNGFDDDLDFDDVINPDTCVNCTVVERCGDGILQPLRGEECDDGNRLDGDGCSSDCKFECRATGRPCDVVSQCCSPADKVCEGPTRPSQTCQVCKAVGKPCARYKQCCGSANKVCEGPTRRSQTCQVCKAVGKPCARKTQCCGSSNKVCDGPAGKPKSCQVCKKRNAACARSTQCCAGLKCKNRKCLP
jgi:cysteine-rich repeat protein